MRPNNLKEITLNKIRMKRREALKNIGLSAAFFMGTPAVLNLMQSCTGNTQTWVPEFLNEEEGLVLKNLVDVILPKTEDLPSGLELNIPQFIDKFMNEIFDDESQMHAKTLFAEIIGLLKPNSETPIDELSQDNFKTLLDDYMLTEDFIDQDRESDPETTKPTKSEFLNTIKLMTINAYRTSQLIGETILPYDPVPGTYFCGDLDDITGGKSWSL